MSQRKFRRKVGYLAQKYGINPEEIIRRINLTLDLRPTTVDLNLPADQFRPSSFRVPVHFTRFTNGEYKAEILTSIRNMDVYIVQDVENLRRHGTRHDIYSNSKNGKIDCTFSKQSWEGYAVGLLAMGRSSHLHRASTACTTEIQ